MSTQSTPTPNLSAFIWSIANLLRGTYKQADLVVIGSRGLAGKTRSFLGSTASQVVTYSPCSVLVVKTQD